jgi:hypothetical protein
MLEGQGKLINRKTKTAGKEYDRFFIYVPTEVARDGTFPFKEGEGLRIRIDAKGKRVVIEKVKDENKK